MGNEFFGRKTDFLVLQQDDVLVTGEEREAGEEAVLSKALYSAMMFKSIFTFLRFSLSSQARKQLVLLEKDNQNHFQDREWETMRIH